MEEKNNGISDSRYKSRFFKKLAAWMGKRGAVLTAVVLIAVSAILAYFLHSINFNPCTPEGATV